MDLVRPSVLFEQCIYFGQCFFGQQAQGEEGKKHDSWKYFSRVILAGLSGRRDRGVGAPGWGCDGGI